MWFGEGYMTTWQKSTSILKKRFNQHGLTDMLEAVSVCQQAELLYPDLFKAVSVRKGTLHIALQKSKTMPFKMIEGKLLLDLNIFAKAKNLPPVEKVRLTFSE